MRNLGNGEVIPATRGQQSGSLGVRGGQEKEGLLSRVPLPSWQRMRKLHLSPRSAFTEMQSQFENRVLC